MARFLVTGGAGFIGSAITRAVLARGDAVRVVDDFSTGHEANLEGASGDLEISRADIRDPDAMASAMRDVQGVFHQAALVSVVESVEHPPKCDSINVHGTVVVLDAARRAGVRKLVLASSAAVYGDQPESPKREDLPQMPLSPYGVSKAADEHYAAAFSHLYGMHTVALRYFNVYGPKQDPHSPYAAAIPAFVRRMVNGQRPVVFGDGEQTRDFCFVEDVARANLAALDAPAAKGRVVNIASGRPISINRLLETLNQVMGTGHSPEHTEPRAGDIRHSLADVDRASQWLGFRAETDLVAGLHPTVAFYRDYYAKPSTR